MKAACKKCSYWTGKGKQYYKCYTFDCPAFKRRERRIKDEKIYIIVYEKLDGKFDPVIIEKMTINKLKTKIKKGDVGEVAIIDGVLLRDLNDDKIDFEKL